MALTAAKTACGILTPALKFSIKIGKGAFKANTDGRQRRLLSASAINHIMKTLALIWKNICYYYRCSRSVFSLFIVGLLSASLLLIYLYGNLNPSVEAYSADDAYARSYIFIFRSTPELETLKTLLNRQGEADRITYKTSALLKSAEGQNERLYQLGCEVSDSSDGVRRIRGRAAFTEEEKATGANVAILSESAEMYASGNIMNLGTDTININGVKFTVIGTASLLDCDILIPASTYKENGYEVLAVKAILESKPSYYENLEFLRDIREQFPDASIDKHPYSSYENSKRDTLSVMLVLSVVFAAAIAAFMFLLKYLSDSTDYIGAIQSICGAPKDTVVFIKLASVFLMTFSVSAVGVALHALLYGPVFSKLNTIQGLIYQPRDYLLILCMCCIAAVLVSVPFVVSFSRGSAAAFKRRLE